MSDLGTSLAAHTRYQVIHAAAWMEFSAHLQELVAEGRERDALRLWASVVEIVHLAMHLQRAWIAWRCSGLPLTSARWTFCRRDGH